MALLLLLLSLIKSLSAKVDICVDGKVKTVSGAAALVKMAKGAWLVADESCDGVDNDCDGTVDEDPASGGTTYYSDPDGDGYGTGTGTTSCAAAKGEVPTTGDCDPTDPTVSPGATETCNGRDDDCDGSIDDGVPTSTWYADADLDGHGAGTGTEACAAPAGSVATGDDCDDTDAAVHPDAADTCNGVDDNCDGSIDDGATMGTWYTDADHDGHGAGTGTVSCAAPAGSVATGDDCNDADATIHPGATDTCDFVDTDCDGTTDDDATLYTWWSDGDYDGYGSGPGITTCIVPMDITYVGGDCDDGDSSVYPGATDVCDERDNDCDGTTDEDATLSSWYTDEDGDGYGDVEVLACAEPAGASPIGGDCDDFDASVSPGATDDCDGVDSDCDGTVDDVQVSFTTSTGTTDLTATFEAGTASAPVSWSTTTSGTLRLCDGTWYARVRASGTPMNLTVESVSGDPAATILDAAGGTGVSIAANSGSVSLRGLTIQGATAGFFGDYYPGNYGPAARMTDTVFSANTYALFLSGGTATLEGSRIEGSSSYGILAAGSRVNLGTGTELSGNAVGVQYDRDSQLLCSHAALLDNTRAISGSGSLYSSGCDFGTSAAGDDNGSPEVEFSSSIRLHPGNDASFYCSPPPSATCGTPSTTRLHTVVSLTETLSGEGAIGVLLTASRDFELRGFSWPVTAIGCSPTYTLYEGYTLGADAITPGAELGSWSPAASSESSLLTGWGYYSGDAWVEIDEGQDYYLELSYTCGAGTSMDVGLDDAPASSSLWTQGGVVSWTTAGDFLYDPDLAPVLAQLSYAY